MGESCGISDRSEQLILVLPLSAMILKEALLAVYWRIGGVRVWQRRSWLEQWEPRAKSRRSPKTSPGGCWYLQKATLGCGFVAGRDKAMLLLCSKRFTRHFA